MNLTLNQSEVLVHIERHQSDKCTQRRLAKKLDFSFGVINRTLMELQDSEVIKTRGSSMYDVTLKGYEVLEPYRVKKAVFLAAGSESRMAPITSNTPKSLVLVHGERIIETLLDVVVAAGIEDTTTARGYLREQSDVSLHEYSKIRFIENPLFNETNDISSAYLIKDIMCDAYMLKSDPLLYNPEITRRYGCTTNYCGIKTDVINGWCFYTRKSYISRLVVGGKDCHQMVGISFWNKEDGEKMMKNAEEVFKMPGGKEKYWDEMALREKLSNHKVTVKPVRQEDIVEIDTPKGLKQIDLIYNV